MGQAKHVKKEAEAAEITAGAGGGGGAVSKAPQSVRPRERRWIATKNLAKKSGPTREGSASWCSQPPHPKLLFVDTPSSFLLPLGLKARLRKGGALLCMS